MKKLQMVANLIIISGIISFLCLLILHFVSPEFNPAWRMVSEYALGNYKWLLTSFFFIGSLGSILSSYLLWNITASNWAKFGAVLILVSGIGGLMGGVFDVRQKLHGLAFILGVPTFQTGVLLIAFHLIKTKDWSPYRAPILFSTHATWICLIFMAVSMVLMFSTFQKAGISMGPNAAPPKTLPEGVVAINGYANRLLILCNMGWTLLIPSIYLRLKYPKDPKLILAAIPDDH